MSSSNINVIIMSEEKTQQGDLEAQPLFAEALQALIKKNFESKKNPWFYDDRNLADDCVFLVLQDHKNMLN